MRVAYYNIREVKSGMLLSFLNPDFFFSNHLVPTNIYNYEVAQGIVTSLRKASASMGEGLHLEIFEAGFDEWEDQSESA